MDFKKGHFPQSKAPEIARKKVMQYIYWSSQKKSINKRFYLSKIYAPVFVVLILFIWTFFLNWEWMISKYTAKTTRTLFNLKNFSSRATEEIKIKDSQLESFEVDSIKEKSKDIVKDIVFVERYTDEKYNKQENQNYVNNNEKIVYQKTTPELDNTDSFFYEQETVDASKVLAPETMVLATEATDTKSYAEWSDQDSLDNLYSQITELENIMKDISNLTQEEESLF